MGRGCAQSDERIALKHSTGALPHFDKLCVTAQLDAKSQGGSNG